MSAMTGDFIGFSYNGKTSSELGILRVSDGSRYNTDLLPTSQDKVIPIPGADGTYFFGSQYSQRQIPVSFVFDSLSENQLHELRRVFGDKKIHDLIFEEEPYKIYKAKVTGTATLKYICFDEGPENRLYKGEGSIQFTCFFPYARSKFKFLDKYTDKNKTEWKAASGMKDTQGALDKIDGSGRRIPLYNPGDLSTDFILKLNFSNGAIPAMNITLGSEELDLFAIKKKESDTAITIDSKTNLIEGWNSSGQKSGTIYNEAKKAGDFFKIPVASDLVMNFSTSITNLAPEIKYDYYYY